MGIEDVIKDFCSRSSIGREYPGNKKSPEVIDSSRSSQYSHQENNKLLVSFVTKCSAGLNVTANEIITNMLSLENHHEIICGLVSEPELRVYIEVWIRDGKLYIATWGEGSIYAKETSQER